MFFIKFHLGANVSIGMENVVVQNKPEEKTINNTEQTSQDIKIQSIRNCIRNPDILKSSVSDYSTVKSRFEDFENKNYLIENLFLTENEKLNNPTDIISSENDNLNFLTKDLNTEEKENIDYLTFDLEEKNNQILSFYEEKIKELSETIGNFLENEDQECKLNEDEIDAKFKKFLVSIRNYHKILSSQLKNEKSKFLRLNHLNKHQPHIESKNKENIEYLELYKRIKTEKQMTKIFFKMYNFLLKKNRLFLLGLRMKYLIHVIVMKKNYFENIKDFLQLIENPLEEFLYDLGSLAFKFKDLFGILFSDTQFGKYENFQLLINSTMEFNIWSQKIFKVLTEMNKDQLKTFVTKINQATNRHNDNHNIDKIFEDFNKFLFNQRYIESENYFLGNDRSEYIDTTKNIFNSIPKEILKKDNLTLNDYNFEKDELVVDRINFWKEKNFIYFEIVDFIINLKYKLFNAKMIFYSIERLNMGKNLSKFGSKLFVLDFLTKIITVNEGKMLYTIIYELLCFLNKCSEMKNHSMTNVYSYIDILKKNLSKIDDDEVKTFLYIVKVMIENNK
ncbi:hypothetical protein GVAV_000614 [Gurleya vavrai]